MVRLCIYYRAGLSMYCILTAAITENTCIVSSILNSGFYIFVAKVAFCVYTVLIDKHLFLK